MKHRLYSFSLSHLLWFGWRTGLNVFGFPQWPARTTGRFYLDQFLDLHSSLFHGDILEFYPSYYQNRISNQRVGRYDVINLHLTEGANKVGDLMSSHSPEVDGKYDLIICTQVLEHVENPFVAVGTLQRWLKIGGHAIVTVPSAFPYHPDPKDYWRFTQDSILLLFQEWDIVDLKCYGNRLAVVASYWYWMTDNLPKKSLLHEDEKSPTIIAVVAQRKT